MQNRRENRDDEPMHFGGFGAQSSMMSSLFGGKEPFDDPFFTRPFGSMSGSMFGMNAPFSDSVQVSGSKGPVIQELDSSDEGEDEEGNGKSDRDENFEAEKSARSEKGPIVEHPDDSDNEKHSRDVSYRNRIDPNRVRGKQPQTQSVIYRKVSYGGIDGTYYTATSTRKTGSDGVMVEESKQADSTTGQASHRISRGVHDKGHSVTRKLNPDGKVDTVQTLHNLGEDELTGFEEAWKGNAEVNLGGWSDGSSLLRDAEASARGRTIGLHDWGLPFGDRTVKAVGTSPNNEDPNRDRTKKVVRINIE